MIRLCQSSKLLKIGALWQWLYIVLTQPLQFRYNGNMTWAFIGNRSTSVPSVLSLSGEKMPNINFSCWGLRSSGGILNEVCSFLSPLDQDISAWSKWQRDAHCDFQKVGLFFQRNTILCRQYLHLFYNSFCPQSVRVASCCWLGEWISRIMWIKYWRHSFVSCIMHHAIHCGLSLKKGEGYLPMWGT